MNTEQMTEIYNTYRRYPHDKREGVIMYEGMNSDDRYTIVNFIEDNIKELKNCRYSDEKAEQYNLISGAFQQYFKQTATATFTRKTILSFFDEKTFPLSTRDKHAKQIIATLKENAIITDDKAERVYRQQRINSLKTNDFDYSFYSLMKANGYTRTNYFIWKCDKEGVPRRIKVATSNINGTPRDENGKIYEGDIAISVHKQTIPRDKQGVYTRSNKSVSIEKRQGLVKCFKVIA